MVDPAAFVVVRSRSTRPSSLSAQSLHGEPRRPPQQRALRPATRAPGDPRPMFASTFVRTSHRARNPTSPRTRSQRCGVDPVLSATFGWMPAQIASAKCNQPGSRSECCSGTLARWAMGSPRWSSRPHVSSRRCGCSDGCAPLRTVCCGRSIRRCRAGAWSCAIGDRSFCCTCSGRCSSGTASPTSGWRSGEGNRSPSPGSRTSSPETRIGAEISPDGPKHSAHTNDE